MSTFTAATAKLEKPTRFFFLTRLQLAPSLCFGAREQSCCSCSSMSKSWGEGAKVREMPKDNKQKVSLQKGLGGVSFWVFFVRCLKRSSGKRRWEESCWRTVSIHKDLLRTGDAPPARKFEDGGRLMRATSQRVCWRSYLQRGCEKWLRWIGIPETKDTNRALLFLQTKSQRSSSGARKRRSAYLCNDPKSIQDKRNNGWPVFSLSLSFSLSHSL